MRGIGMPVALALVGLVYAAAATWVGVLDTVSAEAFGEAWTAAIAIHAVGGLLAAGLGIRALSQ